MQVGASPLYSEHSPRPPPGSVDGDSVSLESFGPEGSAANPMLRGWQEIRCRCEHAPYHPVEYHPLIKRQRFSRN